MPSSYSPDLRLELPADGEQTGLWGQTTNRNLGTLIESAIAGSTTVSVTTANQAMTALNGADDQSRHAMLVLNTTTGAAFAVYAPPASKTYIVRNASSYTATIYNSTAPGNTTAAGAGVAIPAGKTLLVFSDGTDFRTIDAANLTGTLAVANGGTGATDASGARTNLGLVIGTNVPSPTGTGASGTWNISILGNAATATSATSATTATQLASTLAIAAGGTGQTTAAGAFNALKQAATESATGVVELATDAEAQAFTAGKVVDGAKLNTAFQGGNQSLGASGYQKLPGGLIIQWGSATSASGTSAPSLTNDFPIPFPTACVSFQATPYGGGLTVDGDWMVVFSTTQYGARHRTDNETYTYLALGY